MFVQGFVMNVQPLGAEAGFDLRLTPTTDAEEMRRRIAKEWAPAVRNMSYEVRFLMGNVAVSFRHLSSMLSLAAFFVQVGFWILLAWVLLTESGTVVLDCFTSLSFMITEYEHICYIFTIPFLLYSFFILCL